MNLNNELPYIVLLPLSSLLWMLGGWKWKGWRRFVLPLVFLSSCLLAGVSLLQSLGVLIIALIATALPYGENSTWTQRIITSVSFGMIGIPLGLSLTMVIPPIVFILGWIASNKMKMQWKIVEGLTGLAVAIPIADLLHGYIG